MELITEYLVRLIIVFLGVGGLCLPIWMFLTEYYENK